MSDDVPDCTCHFALKASRWLHAEGCAFRVWDEQEQDRLVEYYDRIDRERKERFIFGTPGGGAEVVRRRK